MTAVDVRTVFGHDFRHPELLRRALTHTSVPRARAAGGENYERLEFLGDRVLALVVAEMLLEEFPAEREGAIARRHAALVRREALARVATGLGLARFLHLSRGEEESGGRSNPALLADACEAVIGALYLDGGLEAAARFVRGHWRPLLAEAPTPPRDAKTALQEWAQARGLALPTYRLVAAEGPPHEPRFTVEVALAGVVPALAKGASKRAAEKAAARALLRRLEKGAEAGTEDEDDD
ncbi:MAG: ribonuclease III [Proteobacteria bacterium]|nr:ribonuclease III [Pseudomonadota bacterium]